MFWEAKNERNLLVFEGEVVKGLWGVVKKVAIDGRREPFSTAIALVLPIPADFTGSRSMLYRN